MTTYGNDVGIAVVGSADARRSLAVAVFEQCLPFYDERHRLHSLAGFYFSAAILRGAQDVGSAAVGSRDFDVGVHGGIHLPHEGLEAVEYRQRTIIAATGTATASRLTPAMMFITECDLREIR